VNVSTLKSSTNIEKANLKRAFDLCTRKTRSNIKRLADAPKAAPWAVDGNYFGHPEVFFEIGNWTSSFFTGMALIAWQETEDEYFLNQVLRLAPAYQEKALATLRGSTKGGPRRIDMHHDAGFLYSLYSVALHKLTGDKPHRETGLAAAEALYQRFNPTGGFIRAWGALGTDEHENMAIIDCMMNLPLFYWATKESGDPKFRAAAVRQANTTLKNFVRSDNSVFHTYRFDLKTGQPVGGDNYCGFSTDSYWARGATWAIYGFALSYGYTQDLNYLSAALRLTRKFIAQLDDQVVPIWDFKLTADAPHIRDSSAGAIAVCGFQELDRLGVADQAILNAKQKLLGRLCSDKYLDFSETCPGVLKNAQANVFGRGTAGNVFASWGDYFLMEALAWELFQAERFW
jgi:unsaturated chondroitin disaccharide hydrolase